MQFFTTVLPIYHCIYLSVPLIIFHFDSIPIIPNRVVCSACLILHSTAQPSLLCRRDVPGPRNEVLKIDKNLANRNSSECPKGGKSVHGFLMVRGYTVLYPNPRDQPPEISRFRRYLSYILITILDYILSIISSAMCEVCDHVSIASY